MCAAALMKLKITCIYYGCPNDKFGGCGSVVDMLEMTHKLDPEYKISISGGHRAEEAVEMLKHFYDGENPNAPNPKVKGVRIKKTKEKEDIEPS